MTPQSFVRQFSLLLFIFCVHRVASLERLQVDPEATSLTLLKALVVGFASDFWISLLASIFLVILRRIAKLLGASRSSSGVACAAVLGIIFVLILGHQSYIDFFRHQMLWEHFSYLVDQDFLSANGQSFFSLRTGLIVLLTSLFVWFLHCGLWIFSKNYRHSLSLNIGIVITGLVLHMFNIRYRDQWYVEDQLQLNVAENLLRQAGNREPVIPLSTSERRYVDQALTSIGGVEQLNHLNKILPTNELHQILSVKNNLPFHVIVVLAESFRPSETGWYHATNKLQKPKATLTPRFDELSRDGFTFAKAYSTSTVTRTGQEAVWCGVQSTPENSLMRQFTRTKITCLPKVLSQFNDVSTVWIHGGEGAFDGQATFWKAQHSRQVIDRHRFKTKRSENGWGYSDRTLFQESLLRLRELDKDTGLRVVHSMLLTMSNHIPWNLPSDTPKTIDQLEFDHPQYATTAYFDFALGEFVDQLKDTNMWNRSLLIVVSDHGNLETPYIDYKGPKDYRRAELLTHINLLVTGGLLESLDSTRSKPVDKRMIQEHVGQAQIANFLGEIIVPLDSKVNFPIFPESIEKAFSSPFVWSSVEKGVYLPEQVTFMAKIPSSLEELDSEKLKLGIADFRNQQSLITNQEKK